MHWFVPITYVYVSSNIDLLIVHNIDNKPGQLIKNYIINQLIKKIVYMWTMQSSHYESILLEPQKICGIFHKNVKWQVKNYLIVYCVQSVIITNLL